MPELPEVETMVRGIRPFVEGRELAALRTCGCRCRPIQMRPGLAAMSRRSLKCTVTRVFRRAKRVVIALNSGDAFVIEPRMTGLMLLDDPPDREHLRLEWAFADRREFNSLWFWDRRGLGTVQLLNARELDERLHGAKLGPDALDMDMDLWARQLARTARPIKVALLDQALVAGIGNLYASEILHLAAIHPSTRADRIRGERLLRLHESTRRVLETAIRYEGSTLGDGTYRNALNQSGSYQNEHRVYQRAGETCPTCRHGEIRRVVQAQRSTFFCPHCQRRGAK